MSNNHLLCLIIRELQTDLVFLDDGRMPSSIMDAYIWIRVILRLGVYKD